MLRQFELSAEPGIEIRQHQALIVRPRASQTSGSGSANAGMPLRVKRLRF